MCGLPVMGVGAAGSRRTEATQVPADACQHRRGRRVGSERALLVPRAPGAGPAPPQEAASLPGEEPRQDEGRRRGPGQGCRGHLRWFLFGLGTVTSFCKENKIKQGMCSFSADRLLWV